MLESRPAIFLDRDGVIVENRADYVKTLAEIKFIPGALAAVARLAERDWHIIIVTNQAGIGHGRMTLATVQAINAKIEAAIVAAGGRIDKTYFCPHRPNEHCECRKPAPGMLRRAANELNLDLTASVLIGDAATDVQAAHNAGARAILVNTGLGAQQQLSEAQLAVTPIVADVSAAIELVLHHSQKRPFDQGRWA